MTSTSPTYYIGDIHGRHDLLALLAAHVERDAEARGRPPVFSFLGDIVDRGPDSMQAMELVHSLLERWKGSVLHLGNHDEWFLDAVRHDGRSSGVESWIVNGGIATIESYTPDIFDYSSFALIRERYPHHVEMLSRAVLYTRSGPFISAHAGIEPGIPLDRQKPRSFNWIRDPFLLHADPDMTPVIHGHTIVGQLPVVTENRVSLDTGAFETDRLTCFCVDPERREFSFFQTVGGDVIEVAPKRVDRGHGTLMDRVHSLFEPGRELEMVL